MDKCPYTGAPCSNPKVIHITEVGPDYTATEIYDLCQSCSMGKNQQTEEHLYPIVKNLFDLLAIIINSKNQTQDTSQKISSEPIASVRQKPPCPNCGTTAEDVVRNQRLGCSECYEHYKIELLPILIHAHKSSEHVGKRPKYKEPVIDSLPIPEQIYVLEMQMKLAVEQEQYEKAKEIKDKLTALKSINLQSEPPSN